MSLERNKATVRRWIEVVANESRFDELSDIFYPDYVTHGLPAEMAPGPEGAKQMVLAFKKAFPDFRMTIEEMVAEGNAVMARWKAVATHQGLYRGIAPTGKKVNIFGIALYHFVGDKIKEGWLVRDDLGTLRQLGVNM